MSQPPEDPFATPNNNADASATPPPAAPQPEQPGQPQPGQPQYGAPQYAAPPQGAPQPGQPPYGAPQYAAQPPQQPYKNPATAKNWMGITSLVTSILGISLAGIIFGHLGRSAVRKGEADNPGMSLAGLIIGYIGMVLSIIAIIAMFAFFGWFIDECGGSNPADWCTSEVSYTWEAQGA
ncbi:DUF4190 domain-containing protein [Demequina sp. B12]|uniref:DUF4190 domain-containing protein n=1 Tax=Demequina sp. B12 TaxID=2992757 RepID=UPI00237BAE33|nr:DUF4190 domain-containing protein [Demequina sp. B12]MDE0573498.1 DUF4190 domain-containing protein [Demequina sp. B12]